MNRSLFLASLTLASVAACTAPAPATTPPPPAAAAAAPSAPPAAAEASTVAGIVAEAMNSGSYTYARLQDGPKDLWIAANEFPVATGDRITATVDMPMENFTSKTLNRSFPLIYFVGNVARNGQAVAASGLTGAPKLASSRDPAPAAAIPQVVAPIAPAPGGMSIAEIWNKRQALSGKVVVVRGQVVKVNNEIMGSNWFHLQDGSGTANDGTNDLTITTSAPVKVGDIVTVSGTLATGKDFGAGYAYDAIIEKATVTQGKAADNR